ncbi:MAG TPA: protein kinase, partial [Candidatus Acidoferrum sp.]|nr:protein kinase [Candidatus Acidoferrum sp.]
MSHPESLTNPHSAGHVIGGGRYSLHVPLGGGNHVWLAQDEVEQRLVTIRFFPSVLREDTRAWDALKRRALSVLAVQHANVCRAIDWYEAPGADDFLVTEYVEGQPLAPDVALPVANASTWEQLVPIASSIATALAALHEAGIVHHGVNPANVIATGSEAKLL